jgi:hypothetical protein
MIKNIILLAALFSINVFYSQSNTEVYLFDINPGEEGLTLSNMTNVSNNPGYDNQPSFIYEDVLLFAGNNKGQTDIMHYIIKEKKYSWFHKKTAGGEYSPQKLPLGDDIAAVRLDPDGLQRLYFYNSSKENPRIAVTDLAVAYFHFYTNNILVSAVLGENTLDLVVSNLQEKTNDTLLIDVGRSIHRVPNSKYVSYTALNEEKNHDLYLLEIDGDLESYFVCQLPIGVEDYTWLNDTQILIGSRNKLYVYDTMENEDWIEVADLSLFKIKDISRLSVSPKGSKLAIVGEPIKK